MVALPVKTGPKSSVTMNRPLVTPMALVVTVLPIWLPEPSVRIGRDALEVVEAGDRHAVGQELA